MPSWDLTKNDSKNTSNLVNPFDITKQPGKRGPVESPERRAAKRSNIYDWQVCEFVWAFLEGTKTTPDYKNLTWEQEEITAEDDLVAEDNGENVVIESDDDSEEEEVEPNDD